MCRNIFYKVITGVEPRSAHQNLGSVATNKRMFLWVLNSDRTSVGIQIFIHKDKYKKSWPRYFLKYKLKKQTPSYHYKVLSLNNTGYSSRLQIIIYNFFPDSLPDNLSILKSSTVPLDYTNKV